MKGCTVVVTRAADRARPLVDALTGAGAAVVEVPVVRFEAPADGGGALAAAVADPTRYAWVVFTSAVAVARTLEVVGVPGRLASLKVAVVGPATAAAVEAVGLAVTVVASPATAEGLVASMPDAVAPVPNVLYPRAAGARDAVAAGLRAKGYEVEDIEAYRTVAVPIDDLR
ncbi:MAG TPA: uroporphyrinogen-III synthase, partial [Acidimicrobiales bacterium]|nr:uroporphyrinogen-III synthase [Acidimicrobiales bacterium]